ncbi:helix-turn-helix transcriptional regulator [Paenibacillus kribbensis]|uniref:helix-turn-helix transcriptional regulator n=1 Tax=Paenibacillus kribbensis TaxID=172713 RepID=UPI000837D255|nr:YafY family protein [Paenibacillus kribbensis]
MKIDRLISIIMLLLERRKISAPTLAEMFEVTPRTIYRDIEAINKAGIPIVTYPGVNGGISIVEEYKFEKKLFTVSDITTLLVGLGSLHSTVSSDDFLNTLAKVKALFPKEEIREFENQVIIDQNPWFGLKSLKPNFIEIKTAIHEKRLLSFRYRDQSDKSTDRIIEPYRLVLKDTAWYLQGYCTMREGMRVFRVSRISLLKLMKENFIPRELDMQSLDYPDEKQRTVQLLIDESLRELMEELCGEDNIKLYDDQRYIVQFPFVDNDYWYNSLMKFGDKCECLEPEHIRNELIQRIKQLCAVYNIPTDLQ